MTRRQRDKVTRGQGDKGTTGQGDNVTTGQRREGARVRWGAGRGRAGLAAARGERPKPVFQRASPRWPNFFARVRRVGHLRYQNLGTGVGAGRDGRGGRPGRVRGSGRAGGGSGWRAGPAYQDSLERGGPPGGDWASECAGLAGFGANSRASAAAGRFRRPGLPSAAAVVDGSVAANSPPTLEKPSAGHPACYGPTWPCHTVLGFHGPAMSCKASPYKHLDILVNKCTIKIDISACVVYTGMRSERRCPRKRKRPETIRR